MSPWKTTAHLRGVIAVAAACASLHAVAATAQSPRTDADPAPASARFTRSDVQAYARELAERPYQAPPATPAALAELDYDTYRQIRYARGQAIWGDSSTRFAVELFAPGFLYRDLIDIWVVEDGAARPVAVTAESFDAPAERITEALVASGKYAGFRLHYPLNRTDYRDEFLVFQGASYFRGVSKGQEYGLSARGLAIDVGEATGEEFPLFRAFWIERPAADANAIVVHAALDSPRVTGAYTFAIYPGEVLTMDVTATLYARATLRHVGLAPLTSMFLHGPGDPSPRADYRPRVHDSDGLAIQTASGERLWRPVQNPPRLQFSAFVDPEPPRLFGLVQRARDFRDYQDLEASYERRPSAWVDPTGAAWTAGAVTLVEIPTPGEINDNIVAYYRPDRALEPGEVFDFAYRLTWPNRQPAALGRSPLATVVRTARGRKLGDTSRVEIVIDYALPTDTRDATAFIEALSLNVSAPPRLEMRARVQANGHTPGYRVFLDFIPPAREVAELRVQPMREGVPAGETWLYRLVP